ncbi:MAG: peptide chain release factor N(5)-glutamine methyltransferase [Bacteroidales bacterium]|nr:peptide chain release factor N(5)-glutamine methyltransferase [Bacteroidales bacterium]
MKTKSNRIGDIKKFIHNELKNKYSNEEIKSFTNILFSSFTNLSSAHITAFEQETINESELLKIYLAVEDLKKYKPIQYIIGKVEFLNIDIKVNENVLIPRPETEELCQYIIQENKDKEVKIVDLCSGSGCISLALAYNIKKSKVYGVDVSLKALELAKKNANNLKLNVIYRQNDILDEGFDIEEDFDIIVSNPPYVRELEKKQMSENVLNYEPHLALFVNDENPLIFYEKIVQFAQKRLKKGGKIYLEVNNFLASETIVLFSEKEYVRRIVKDIFDKDRFIFLEKK